MINTGKLSGLTVFITGASRGIGKEIGVKVARDGANVVIAAKTAEPHPKLQGTIYTAAKEIEAVGGKCLPCVVDVRNEEQVRDAVQKAVDTFGGIDIVVNNCSAISLTGTCETDMKKYDLMNQVNARGTFLTSKLCIPYLKNSKHAHILNISPPINLNPIWFKNHTAYTIAKYGMSMCAIGMSEEFKSDNVAVNCLWPRTGILTAAIEMLVGSEVGKTCRTPAIMADAAYAILSKDPTTCTGNFFIDDDILSKEGVTDFDQYLVDPSKKDELMPDFFLDSMTSSSSSSAEPSFINKRTISPVITEVNKAFKVVEKLITPELITSVQAVYQFNLKDGDATWFVDLRIGTSGVGKSPLPPDCTLTATAKDTLDLVKGRLKPATAVMTGKLKIEGNLHKALKLESLLTILKSKL